MYNENMQNKSNIMIIKDSITDLRNDIILANEVHTVAKLLKNKGCIDSVIPDNKKFALRISSPLSFVLEAYHQHRLNNKE